jgi:hypothetical protein
MNTDAPVAESSTEEASTASKAARSPPIILTSAANLIQLQKKLKGVARQNVELRNTRSENSLAYFTFSLSRRNL